MRLLIVDDDVSLSRLLCRSLCAGGDEVAVAHDGEAAMALFDEREPDLLLLDLQLPRSSGREVLAAVRARAPLCPILVLSGVADTETRIRCLAEGADDCLPKPFALGELRARCRALLRRTEAIQANTACLEADWLQAGPPVLRAGTLTLERVRRQVEAGGEVLQLTNREFAMLEALLLAVPGPVSRSVLRSACAIGNAAANVLDVHMAALRRKLGVHSRAPQIETLRGYGYRLVGGTYA